MNLVMFVLAAVVPHHQIHLNITSKSVTPREELVNVTIPHRYVVTGVAMAADEPMVSLALDRGEAWARYWEVVQQIKDPAVVEWIDDDHVAVRVFPVSRNHPVEITLELGRRGQEVVHVTRETSVLALPEWARDQAQYAFAFEPVLTREMFAPNVGDEEPGDD